MTQLNAARGGFARRIRFIGMGISHPMYSLTSAAPTTPNIDAPFIGFCRFEPSIGTSRFEPVATPARFEPVIGPHERI